MTRLSWDTIKIVNFGRVDMVPSIWFIVLRICQKFVNDFPATESVKLLTFAKIIKTGFGNSKRGNGPNFSSLGAKASLLVCLDH